MKEMLQTLFTLWYSLGLKNALGFSGSYFLTNLLEQFSFGFSGSKHTLSFSGSKNTHLVSAVENTHSIFQAHIL
jgi:hypothetical protein